MKFILKNDNLFTIYIPKYYYKYDSHTIDDFIYKILLRLVKMYDIELYSIFNVDCYKCDNYGIILEITKEYDAFLIYSKKSDININLIDSKVMYEVLDYYDNALIDNDKIYVDSSNNIAIEDIVDVIYKPKI